MSVEKRQLTFASTKSIVIQIILGFVLLIGCFSNLFINWGYFDEYSGSFTFRYNLAHAIWQITSYGFLTIVITLICSLYFFIKNNKKGTKGAK